VKNQIRKLVKRKDFFLSSLIKMKLVNVPYLEPTDLNGKQINGVTMNGLLMVQGGFCGHCTTAKPAFQKLHDKTQGKFFVATVASEDEPNLVKLLGVQGFPTYFVIRHGKIAEESKAGRELGGMEAMLKTL
jgi:thiol-disulfide isomerase/thioredoxin